MHSRNLLSKNFREYINKSKEVITILKDLCEDRRLLLGMVICTAASILLKCICAIIYHKLLHDSRQLQTTKNKWLRAMLTKYEASYKIRISINDPDCFVSRHLERYHVFKLSLYTLENTDLFAAALLISTSLLALIQGIAGRQPMRQLLLQILIPLFLLSLIGLSEMLFRIRHKKRCLKLQLLDYLENTIQSKLENQYLHPELQKAYQNAYFDITSSLEGQDRLDHMVQLEKMNQKERKEKPKSTFSKEMRELIDSLVQEEKLAKDIQQIEQENTATAATKEKMQLIEEIIKEYL